MATFKYYDGTKYNRITGGLVPKTSKTTSDTETYSCNYVNEITEKNIIYLYLRTFNYSNTFALNEILLNVTENDIITAQVLNRLAGTSLAQYNSMTVEVVE